MTSRTLVECQVKWSFSYNFLVKFDGNKVWEPNMAMLYPNPCYNEVCYNPRQLTTIVVCFLILICLCTLIAYVENNNHPDKAIPLGAF